MTATGFRRRRDYGGETGKTGHIMLCSDQASKLVQLFGEGFVFVDLEFCVRAIDAAAPRMAQPPPAGFIGRVLWEIAPTETVTR